MGGSSKAPAADPAIGQAALLSAQTGQSALDWAKSQAAISNKWAAEDRQRYQTTFRPLEDQFIAASANYDTPERRAVEAQRAQASVQQQAALARQSNERNLAAMGVSPGSGRGTESAARGVMATGLAAVGAGNAAEKAVEAEGRSRLAQAVNLGQGLAVNPGTALSLASSTGNSGFSAAMQGYGQQANILNQDYSNRLAQWQANQESSSALWGGLGSIAGFALSNPASLAFLSDEGSKTNRRRARGALRAVEKMPIDAYDYKPGAGDGGRHVGPMAQDFQRETGLGDGRSIAVQDALGVTMGAVKELSAKVDKLARSRPRGISREAAA